MSILSVLLPLYNQNMHYIMAPRFVVILLMAVITVSFAQAGMFPMDDHFNYQKFVEALASGQLDLSIPGFHGSDFLATLLHIVFPSDVSQIAFQIFAAIMLPLCAYLAGKALFKTQAEVLLFVCILSLMPFIQFVALRGWTGPAYWNLMLLSIAAAPVWPYIAAVLIALAILTKPFALALLPLLFVLQAKKRSSRTRTYPLLLAIALCALYVAVQYVQAGQVIIGSHTELDQLSVWQGPVRIFLNIAHALQILFSVHNYYFPDPALTGPGNMMHTTPVLIFLALWSFFTPSKAKQTNAIRRALFIGFIVGIGLNALLDHMDHFYMEAAILCAIIAAVPLLWKHKMWIPLVLATLHFQWLYFYLEYRDPFLLNWSFFLLPVFVDVLFLLYCVQHRQEVRTTIRSIL